jgi:hypothetical protein
MAIRAQRVLWAAVVLLFAFGLCRAASHRFQEKEAAIRKEVREQFAALGVTRDAAKLKYPTPEIGMISAACIAPGETGEVVVRGKFVPGTKFIFQNDDLEVVKESLAGNEYRATLKAAAGVGPQSAAVVVITPVTGISVRQDNAVAIGGRYEWTMSIANGWKVIARPPAGKSCVTGSSAGQAYDMQFYKAGESGPFETRKATLFYNLYDSENYSFNIEAGNAPAAVEEFTALMQKMSDPGLTAAQRQAVMQELQKKQEQMQASLKQMSGPANIAKAQQQALEFGCERMWLSMQGEAGKGRMRCSDRVGSRLQLTAVMKFVGK